MIQNRAILLTAQDLHGLPRSESLLEKVAEYKNTVDTVTSGEIFAVLKEQSDFEAKKIIAAEVMLTEALADFERLSAD